MAHARDSRVDGGLRIGIDAHVVGRGKGGAETYSEQLITALAALGGDDEYTVFISPEGQGLAERVPAANIRYEVIAEPNLVVQRFVRLPMRSAALGLQVLHVQRVVSPLTRAARVVTIHDLAHTLRPELFDAREGMALRRLIAMSARWADRIVTDSVVSRDDITRSFGVSAGRLAVIPLGVDHCRAAADAVLPALEPLARAPYLLCVGAIETRKNLSRLIEAYATVISGSTGAPDLMLVGPSRTPGLLQELQVHADSLGLSGRVRFAGHVDAARLRALYAGAHAFVFPSLLEGFGLPPLEALSYGLPVAVSDIPVHREMLSDAAVYFDPCDTGAMADALRAVVGDETLRRELRGRGPERASRYTWARTAELTRAAYGDAARARASDRGGWERWHV